MVPEFGLEMNVLHAILEPQGRTPPASAEGIETLWEIVTLILFSK